jgi:hypothetical protein
MMRTRLIALPTLILCAGLAAACADTNPTAIEDPLVGPATAQASQGTHTAGQMPDAGVFTGEFPGTICGIDVITSMFIAGAIWPAPFSGHPPDRETVVNVATFTNPENGQWIQYRRAGQVTREIVAFHEDGSFTVRDEVDGLKGELRVASGPPLTFSAGRIIVQILVVPLPGGGFLVTNVETLFEAGPHREDGLWQSPGFCEIVEGALL